jgi:ABC-type Fe3+ transport system permease subunit
MGRGLLFGVAALLALVAAFFVLLWWSELEADYVNVGTVLGKDDPDPRISTLTVGIVFAVLAALVALVGFSLRRRSP